MDLYPAHIRFDNLSKVVQTAADHCRNTAHYAQNALVDNGLGATAYLAGLLHDMGKFKNEYRDYLEAAVNNNAVRGTVIHTFSAVRYLIEHYHLHKNTDEYVDKLTAELVAYACGAHHGAFDCVNACSESGFEHRITKNEIRYEETVDHFLKECTTQSDIDNDFNKAALEISAILGKLELMAQDTESEKDLSFHLGLLARLLLSAVIEGDRRDTAEFMTNSFHSETEDSQSRKAMWRKVLQTVDNKIMNFPTETPIQCARSRISEICKDASCFRPGVFRLNVPTGAGKTLSSLRFSLAHAGLYGKKRVIFTAPLLSILDQNAAVIREFVGDDGIILEHYSNIIREESDEGELNRFNLLMESWNSPIVITTLVQLLNTLFSGKSSCIRRFQALCDSVIIIDEVQTVPQNMVSLFNLAVDFLVNFCGATIVLCSATQPCFESSAHPIRTPIKNLVPYDSELWKPFKRTEILDAGEMSIDELVAFTAEAMQNASSMLIVCNKKKEAFELFNTFGDKGDYECFHLSSAMCVFHRKQVLRNLENALSSCSRSEKKVLCISTQVMEAGIDISFDRVIRLAAGMDNIVQAAGRCNRNGETNGLSNVYVIRLKGENLSFLKDIQRAKDATLELMDSFRRNPEKYGELTSDEAINYYYKSLYRLMPHGFQDYSVFANGHNTSLYRMLSDNSNLIDIENHPECGRYFMGQAFKTAGDQFSVFDNNTVDVLVPYDKGKEIITQLSGRGKKQSLKELKPILEIAKQFTISLYDWQINKLNKDGGIVSLADGSVMALQEGYYSELTGFREGEGNSVFMEV